MAAALLGMMTASLDQRDTPSSGPNPDDRSDIAAQDDLPAVVAAIRPPSFHIETLFLILKGVRPRDRQQQHISSSAREALLAP